MKKPTKKQMIKLYEEMMKIRLVEETLMDVFSKGEIPGFIHVCIGQEAAPVGVCSHLKDSDYVASNHRGHGHALAKGIDLKKFMAEIFGRKNGPCRGRSGSMHLADISVGLLGANGIVGGGIPIANGAALSSKLKEPKRVTACFFGEGATNEGTFHESLNIASVLNLPVLFVCENNSWAEFTPQSVHMRVENIADRAASYNISSKTVSNDLLEIYDAAGEAVNYVRGGEGPFLLEIKSRRWHGHYVGDAQKYRPKTDIEEAMQFDCIANFEQFLSSEKILSGTEKEKIKSRISEQVEEAVDFAKNSPFPDPSELIEEKREFL